MAELQELLSYQLDDLPDEVILRILYFLDIKELLLFGQASKRHRAIANDESLWLKLNHLDKKVPYDFIEKAAAENGCQYLSLAYSDILNLTEESKSSFNLKYLNLSCGHQGSPKIVQKCSSLQKLSVADLSLDSDDIQYICQNSQTLQVLDLEDCTFHLFSSEPFQDLLTNCAHLTELNICNSYMLDSHIQALVDDLTSKILKVDIGYQENFKDEHLKKLVKRCNKITHLDLKYTLITNDSVQSIIKHLKTCLEKLDVTGTNVDFLTLFQLKTMPLLKTLIFFEDDRMEEDWENLEQQLSHISINEEPGHLHIAKPFKRLNDSFIDYDWIWEIRAKKQRVFKNVDNENFDSDDKI